MLGHPVIQRCQVHKVLCAMATCYVSAVRSLSSQPAPAMKSSWTWSSVPMKKTCLLLVLSAVAGQGAGGGGWHGAGQGGQVVVVPSPRRVMSSSWTWLSVPMKKTCWLSLLSAVAGQGAGGGGWHGAGQGGQVVVGPAPAVDEELVDVVVGADEEDVLAVVAEPVAGQGAGGGGWHGAGQGGQVVVGPAPAVDEELVDVVVGADEEDVLAVVAEPVTGQGAGGRRVAQRWPGWSGRCRPSARRRR